MEIDEARLNERRLKLYMLVIVPSKAYFTGTGILDGRMTGATDNLAGTEELLGTLLSLGNLDGPAYIDRV